MADPADLAQVHEESFRALALAVAHRAAGRGPDMSDGTPRCRECGEEMDPRRVAKCPDAELCVGCQEEADNRR